MELSDFFKEYHKAAIAFSGGVDSAYLLYEAGKSGANVTAYYVKSQFQPQFELDDALRLASKLSVKMKVIEVNVLSQEEVACNPENRCYYCKRQIFGTIQKSAVADGYRVILDGTNASDDVSDRPGMKALEELSVLSPLRICGLRKEEIRLRSKEAGLFTWDKPAYACLATRVKWGERITEEILHKIETAENLLMTKGFRDLRVRVSEGTAIVQIAKAQMAEYMKQKDEIEKELKQYFSVVEFNPQGR